MNFENINQMKKTYLLACAFSCLGTLSSYGQQPLKLNDSEYFERQGINLLVFNNSFNGGFNDEKNSGIELIQHGVRVAQGGAVRLSNTPEQWDLVPKMISRKVDKEHNAVEVVLRYDDYDFESRVVVTRDYRQGLHLPCCKLSLRLSSLS